MSENGGRFRQTCLALFTNGHIIIAATSLLTIAGAAGGVYAALHAGIVENARAEADSHASSEREIDVLRVEIDRLRADMQERSRTLENWQRDEKTYDAEIRAKTDALDTKLITRIEAVDARLTGFLTHLSDQVTQIMTQQRNDYYTTPTRHDRRDAQ